MGEQVTIHASGALFDGRAPRVVAQALEDAKRDVASQGLANWHHNLDGSLRHPTPYYETQITVQSLHGNQVVHDRGIVYGPWLEGVGSRNKTTRFKGYFALRRAFQQLLGQAPQLAERAIRRALEVIR